MQHVGCRSDRIRTKIELESSLFGSSDKTVGGSLVTSDIHVASRGLLLGLYTVNVDGIRVSVVTVVPTGLNDLNVCLCNSGLLGKLLAQEVCYKVQIAIEQPAYESESEHVTALQHSFVVHAAVGQTILNHGSQWALDNTVGVDTHLT